MCTSDNQIGNQEAYHYSDMYTALTHANSN